MKPLKVREQRIFERIVREEVGEVGDVDLRADQKLEHLFSQGSSAVGLVRVHLLEYMVQ